MIDLPADSAYFDLAWEVAVCLPKWPNSVAATDLLNDFQIGSVRDLRKLLKPLTKYGVCIKRRNAGVNTRTELFIDHEAWPKFCQRGREYWYRAYGPPDSRVDRAGVCAPPAPSADHPATRKSTSKRVGA